MPVVISENLAVLIVVALLSAGYVMPLLKKIKRFRVAEFFAVFVLGGFIWNSIWQEVLHNGAFTYAVGRWSAPWNVNLR